MNKKEIITICSSTKFIDVVELITGQLELEGKVVLTVTKLPNPETLVSSQLDILDIVHRQKIDIADVVFIVDVNGYIGNSVKGEIKYAKSKNKPIIYFSEILKNSTNTTKLLSSNISKYINNDNYYIPKDYTLCNKFVRISKDIKDLDIVTEFDSTITIDLNEDDTLLYSNININFTKIDVLLSLDLNEYDIDSNGNIQLFITDEGGVILSQDVHNIIEYYEKRDGHKIKIDITKDIIRVEKGEDHSLDIFIE